MQTSHDARCDARRVPDEITQIFAVEFNNFFVEMARIVTERFHGDLHLFLVLVAISNNGVAGIMRTGRNREKYRSFGDVIEEEYAFTKLLTLAQIVGLPRNTVRGKVNRLVELGFVEYEAGRGCRMIKRTMAGSSRINEILGHEYALLKRLVAEFSSNGVLGPADLGRAPGRRKPSSG